MLWSQHLFLDTERLLKQGLGLLIRAVRSVEVCQSIEQRGHVKVFWTQYMFVDVQRSLIQDLSLRVLTSFLQILRRFSQYRREFHSFCLLSRLSSTEQDMRHQTLTL